MFYTFVDLILGLLFCSEPGEKNNFKNAARLNTLNTGVTRIASQTGISHESVELQLVQDLMTNYDVNARPVHNASSTVEVQVGIGLQQIIDLVRFLFPFTFQSWCLCIEFAMLPSTLSTLFNVFAFRMNHSRN